MWIGRTGAQQPDVGKLRGVGRHGGNRGRKKYRSVGRGHRTGGWLCERPDHRQSRRFEGRWDNLDVWRLGYWNIGLRSRAQLRSAPGEVSRHLPQVLITSRRNRRYAPFDDLVEQWWQSRHNRRQILVSPGQDPLNQPVGQTTGKQLLP